jgi:hypothetical protein
MARVLKVTRDWQGPSIPCQSHVAQLFGGRGIRCKTVTTTGQREQDKHGQEYTRSATRCLCSCVPTHRQRILSSIVHRRSLLCQASRTHLPVVRDHGLA